MGATERRRRPPRSRITPMAAVLVNLGVASGAQIGTRGDHSTAGWARVNRCGADSVFVVSALHGDLLPYSACLHLVPPRDAGNTMLEVKEALQRLGLTVSAYTVQPRELRRLDDTCIAWLPPVGEVRTPSGQRYRLGHFFVLRPHKNGRWLVLDYPKSAEVVDIQRWAAERLSAYDLDGIPVLVVRGRVRPEGEADPLWRGAGAANQVDLESSSNDEQAGPESAPTAAREHDDQLLLTISGPTGDTVQGELDFGEHVQGEELQGTIVIENALAVPASLRGVRTTCSCTAATPDRESLGPGASAVVPVSLSLRGRIGRVVETVSIMLETPEGNVPVVVQVGATALPQWKIDPPSVEFGRVRPDGPALRRSFEVAAAFPDRATRLLGAVSGHPAVRGDLEVISLSEGKYRVEVSLDPTATEPGVLATDVGLVGGGPGWELSVPVTAEIASLIRVSPRRLLLDRRSGFAARLLVTEESGAPIRLVAASSRESLASIQVSTESEPRSASPKLELLVAAEAPANGLVQDEIQLTIETDQGGSFSVAVPVTISAF